MFGRRTQADRAAAEAAQTAETQRRRAELVDQLEKMEMGEKGPDFGGPLEGGLLTNEQVDRWCTAAEMIKGYDSRIPSLRHDWQDYVESDDSATTREAVARKLQALCNVATTLRYLPKADWVQTRLKQELGTDLAEVNRLLVELAHQRYDYLAGRLNDIEGLQEFEQFMESMTGWRQLRPVREAGFNLDYPANWNDLVALHYPDSGVSSFRGLHNYDTTNAVFRAGEALAARQLTTAVILLHLCVHKRGIRPEVGEVLVSQLTIMVAELRAELRAAAAGN